MIKNIIFDFDGVILESNDVKVEGFYKLFLEYGDDKATSISNYFKSNAGLSRYDIIKYFFEKFYNETIDNQKLQKYANLYSDIVKQEVINTKFVDGCESFLSSNHEYKLFIISSSDENDLLYICNKIKINTHFIEILGSPTKKEVNIKKLLKKYSLNTSETIYIGDSINDYHATNKNNLVFIARDSGIYNFNQINDIIIIKDLNNLKESIKELRC